MKHGLIAATAVASLGLLPGRGGAQGFGVYEHGTCAMARAGAAVATGCGDGSSVFFNPSGINTRRGFTLALGVTVIDAHGGFIDDLTGTETQLTNGPIPVPHFYATYGFSDRVAAGFGLFFPYGLGTQWPDTFEGRFNGYDNDLRSMYLQPTLSVKLGDRLSLGAGLDVVIGSVKLNQFLDLSEVTVPDPAVPAGTTFAQLGVPFHTQFATARLDASGAMGIGGHFGLSLKLTESLAFGARYLTRVKLDYDGTATFAPASTGILLPAGNPFGVPAGTPLDEIVDLAFSPIGPLQTQAVTTSLTMPDQIILGLSFEPTESLLLEGDFQWVNWSLFGTLPVDFSNPITPDRAIVENFRDTKGFRFGTEVRPSDRLRLRGGYLYHTAASPPETVTPLLPEGKRHEFTAGFGLALGAKAQLDLAYQYISQLDRRGRVREAPGGGQPTVDLNSGLYSFFAHLVGVTLAYRF